MQYISVRQIMDNVLSDPIMSDLPFERAVNYAVEFIRLMGIPQIFEEKMVIIDIDKHRGELPCDCLTVKAVRETDGCHPKFSQRVFLGSFKEMTPHTYKIQGNYIFTSIPCGKLEVVYKAMPVDEEGFPKIVDNGSFPIALEDYIKKKWFTILFNSGKITQPVLQNMQQQYAWSVGVAQNELVIPSVDEMESIKNMWTEMIPKLYKHTEGFSRLGVPHRYKNL